VDPLANTNRADPRVTATLLLSADLSVQLRPSRAPITKSQPSNTTTPFPVWATPEQTVTVTAADGRTVTISLYATGRADFDVDGHPAHEGDAMRLACRARE